MTMKFAHARVNILRIKKRLMTKPFFYVFKKSDMNLKRILQLFGIKMIKQTKKT